MVCIYIGIMTSEFSRLLKEYTDAATGLIYTWWASKTFTVQIQPVLQLLYYFPFLSLNYTGNLGTEE